MFVLKVCWGEWNSSYENLLARANIPSCHMRHQLLKLSLLFSLINGLAMRDSLPIALRESSFSNRVRTIHNSSLIQPFAHTTSHANSFFPSTIQMWNSLLIYALNLLCQVLWNHYFCTCIVVIPNKINLFVCPKFVFVYHYALVILKLCLCVQLLCLLC